MQEPPKSWVGYLSSDETCSNREKVHLPKFGWKSLSSYYPEIDSSSGVIRQSSRSVVGKSMDIMPRKHRRLRSSSLDHLKSLYQGSETERLLILLRDARLNGVELADLTGRLTLKPSDIRKSIQELSAQGEVQIIDQANFFSMTTAHFNTAQKNILSFLNEYHAQNPLRTGAPREEVRGKAGDINEKIFAAATQILKRIERNR